MRRFSAILAPLVAVLGVTVAVPSAQAYSTKLHLVTGYDIAKRLERSCTIKLTDWARRGVTPKRGKNLSYLEQPARYGNKSTSVTIRTDLCNLIRGRATRQYFISGTVAPDTFPGMLGNTDPTHALHWNTAWQIGVLWQNARTAQEKAFVLGWLVHFAGDGQAHGLANLHATGVWMSNNDMNTVWKHIVTEVYYAWKLTPYPKTGRSKFPNKLVFPEAFVKKMFFNPSSPLYRHYDYLYNKNPTELGAVAKFFGTAYRLMFLLWDWHGRERQRWKGHMDFYAPKRNRGSVGDYLHWLFAEQAYHFHNKRVSLIKEAIDRWYTATVRAQQAVVADPLYGQFSGKGFYSGYKERFGKKFAVKRMYRQGGMGGVMDAYKYLVSAITDYATESPVTITDKNAPALRRFLDKFKSMAAKVYGTIHRALQAMKDVIHKVTEAVKKAVLAILGGAIQKIKEWFKEKALCNGPGMNDMCTAINKQGAAFKVDSRGRNLATYSNWPIYRNTITAGLLGLRKMAALSPRAGDETTVPVFGGPSGDFGCTSPCMEIHQQNWRLFMPSSGMYYAQSAIQRGMPDYCPVGTDTRRSGVRLGRGDINNTYKGTGNDKVNGGFTCYVAQRNRCTGADVYNGATPRFRNRLAAAISKMASGLFNRWSVRTHPARTKRAPRGRSYVNSVKRQEGPNGRSFCYRALTWGRHTIAGRIPNPLTDRDYQRYYRRTSYSLRRLIGRWFAPLTDLAKEKISQAYNWAKRKWNRLVGTVNNTANNATKKVRDAIDKAKRSADSVVRSVRSAFDNALNQAKRIVSDAGHRFHTSCLGEVRKYARGLADKARGQAIAKTNSFFRMVSASLRGLTRSQKRQALAGAWSSVRSSILTQVSRARSRGSSRARNWATLGSTKSKHARTFHSTFDGRVRIPRDIDSIYNRYVR